MKPTLRLKIIGGFMVAIVAALAIGLYARSTLSGFAERSDASARQNAEYLVRISAIESSFLNGTIYATAVSINPDQTELAVTLSLWKSSVTDATVKFIEFASVPMTTEARALYDKASKDLSWNNGLANNMANMGFPIPDKSVPAPTVEEFNANQMAATDTIDRLRAGLRDLREQLTRDAAASRAAVQADADASLNRLTLLTVAACVGLLLFALWLSYVLVRRLRATVKVLDQVAGGDLTARFEAGGQDEVGQMGDALNLSLSTIHDVIRQIEQDADRLAVLARRQLPGAVGGDAASVALSTSQRDSEELAEMAESLNAMITVFITDSGAAPEPV